MSRFLRNLRMGKEHELLKAVKEKDNAKVQKLLSTTVKKSTKHESLCWQSVDSGHKIRVELKHINVNVQEDSTLYTPLHLAMLYGSKEIAERLIFHCADVKAKDSKGNTALHLAVFHGRLDLVELVLFNEAEVNAQNEDGNTALHVACQSMIDQRTKIIKKLIKSGANVWLKNKCNLIALDLAAQYNQTDAVSSLMEFVPTLRDNHTAVVEAAIRGLSNIVELLLEYGINPNHLDENHGSTALHEAVRFNRDEVVKILLAFKASPNLSNPRKETPRSIAAQLPPHTSERMCKHFEDQAQLSPRTPKMLDQTESLESPRDHDSKLGHIKNYPELQNDLTWTQNRPRFCSSCTEKNPNSQILDGNMKTFWVIPVVHDAWTVLDLRNEYIITGITIFGWNSPQMLKTFQLQTSLSLDGPWMTVTSHTCDLLGSTDPKEPAFPQKFDGFTFRSRFVRLYLVDNHGGSCICFQGIQLYGADCQVIDTIQECGLYRKIDDFIHEGFNTWKRFLDITQATLDKLQVSEPTKKAALWEAIYKGRRAMYPMKALTWVTPPAQSVFIGDVLPDFSVQSDPGVTEVVQLVAQGAQLSGNTNQRLSPLGEGKPSVAKFTNISLTPAGMYTILVKGVTTDLTLAAPKPTEVRPEVRSQNDITSAFDEIQQMLSEVQASLPSHK